MFKITYINSDAVGHGSKVHSRISGYLDTLDYEATRGYREFQRALTFQASTLRNPNTLIDGERHPNTTFQWGMIWRGMRNKETMNRTLPITFFPYL